MTIKENVTQIEQWLETEHWEEARILLETHKQSRPLTPNERKNLGLIYFKLKQEELGFAYFSALAWDNYSDCAWLRRLLIAPLIRLKEFAWSAKLLTLIVQAHPHSILDLSTLSSVLIRQNKREEGEIYLEKILTLEEHNYAVAAQLMQLKLQDNKLEQAVSLAEHYAYAYDLNERLVTMALLALSRAKKWQTCLHYLATIDLTKHTLEFNLLAAQVAFDGADYQLSDTILQQLLPLDHNDERLYLLLAKVKLKLKQDEAQAILALEKAHTLAPDHIAVNNLLGELLLKTGNYTQARHHLAKLKALLPNNPHTRLLHARALKFTGDYENAANEMLAVVKLLPHSTKWQRYAASALVQAGRIEEAHHIFTSALKLRDQHLAATFAEGIAQLDQQLETVNLPLARFEWWWSIINGSQPIAAEQRQAYEQEVKWIYLLDHYLLDWLECRPHQADEAMAYFADLSAVSAIFEANLSPGQGLILASAHLGPLYAGPLALELLGFPHQWLASTPSISSMPYQDTLISTSENTETEVVRKVIKALRQGNIVTIAVDGAMNPAAPKIDFAGQQVTYSDFAARMAFRTKTPSFFAIPLWKDNSFCFELAAMPAPLAHDTIDEFCQRWTQQFFNFLRKFLITNPSNARLSGGIWRHVR